MTIRDQWAKLTDSEIEFLQRINDACKLSGEGMLVPQSSPDCAVLLDFAKRGLASAIIPFDQPADSPYHAHLNSSGVFALHTGLANPPVTYSWIIDGKQLTGDEDVDGHTLNPTIAGYQGALYACRQERDYLKRKVEKKTVGSNLKLATQLDDIARFLQQNFGAATRLTPPDADGHFDILGTLTRVKDDYSIAKDELERLQNHLGYTRDELDAAYTALRYAIAHYAPEGEATHD